MHFDQKILLPNNYFPRNQMKRQNINKDNIVKILSQVSYK